MQTGFSLDRTALGALLGILEDSSIGVMLLDDPDPRRGRIVRTNALLRRLTGRSARDLRSVCPDDLFPPGETLRLLFRHRPHDRGAPVPIQTILIRSGKNNLPVEVKPPLTVKVEGRDSLLILVRDISRRRDTESRSRRQERIAGMLSDMNRLLDHTSDTRETALISLDTCLNLLGMKTGAFYLNRPSGLRQIASRDPAGILPKSIPRRALEQESLQRRFIDLTEDGVPGKALLPGLKPGDGSDLTLALLLPLPDEKGRLLGLLLTAGRQSVRPGDESLEKLDSMVGQIARALHNALLIERLEESEAKYRAVLSHATDGFVLFRGNHVLEMNPAFETILRRFALTASKIGPAFLFPDTASEEKPPREETWEKQVRTPDGQTCWLTVSRSSIKLPGRISAFFVRDDTERKQWESFRILSERLSASGSMAAGLAHEINNPLQAIAINLGLLVKTMKADRREQELIDGIHTGLVTIRETVDQLQEIQSAGGAPRRKLRINQVLKKTIGLAAGQLERNGIIVQASLASSLPTTRGSAASLQRAFLNVILNACEAMKGGGTLHIHTYLHRGAIYVRFSDTGVGIEEERQKQIFDVFYTTKARSRGSGLGLSIALNILRQHNGEVYVKSKPGVGASFTIKLPVSD